MNFKVKVLAVMLVCFQTFASAQDNFSITPTVGVASPLLDGGVGFHIGVNPYYSVSSYFAFEGQISYAYVNITSGFLSGETGNTNTGNFLVGGRLFFRSKEKKVRPYINLLMGAMINREVSREQVFGPDLSFGGSVGAFVEIDRFVVGASLDSPQNVTLKVGYLF